MQTPNAAFAGLTFIQFLVASLLEIPILLKYGRTIELRTGMGTSLSLLPSLAINLASCSHTSLALTAHHEHEVSILSLSQQVLPYTFVMCLATELRVFTYYAESGVQAISVLAFCRIIFLSVANLAAIATFKHNPSFRA